MDLMPVALDTETHLFENGKQAPKIVCLQYSTRENHGIVIGADRFEIARAFLLDPNVLLIGQNMAFDMAVLGAEYPDLLPLIYSAYDAGRVHCTKIRQRLLDLSRGRPNSRYSLDELADRHDAEPRPNKADPWRLRYSELDGVPVEEWPDEARTYAQNDPIVTREIWLAQEMKRVEYNYEGFHMEASRQTSYDFALHLMHCWGVRTDPERVKALLRRTVVELEKLTPILQEAHVFSSKGSKIMSVVRARVQDALGTEAPVTPTGAIKTNKDTLQRCGDDVLDAVVEHARLTKLKNTYILKLIEGTVGNIHASFHTLGAETGRTSSSGPNLQNQSTKGGVRECFVPRPGFEFLSADYDAQELRTLAQACLDICRRSKLAKKFQEDPDFDPHTSFASGMMGWDYEDAMRRKAAGDLEVKEMRQRAKAANFGFPGGLGAKNFRIYARGYGVKMNLEQAMEIKEQWFAQWPEMQEYFANAKQIADSGTLVQLRSKRIRGDVGFCDGANSYFQGLASEASKTATYLVSKACYAEPESPLYGCRPVMLVHDELVLEAPSSYAHEAGQELQRLMVKAMEMWCPDVPARATPVVSRCWSKAAEPLFENGRLIPWDLPAQPSQETSPAENAA